MADVADAGLLGAAVLISQAAVRLAESAMAKRKNGNGNGGGHVCPFNGDARLARVEERVVAVDRRLERVEERLDK